LVWIHRAISVFSALGDARCPMAADSRRLSILAAREIEDLYGLPRLTEADRLLYFDLGD